MALTFGERDQQDADDDRLKEEFKHLCIIELQIMLISNKTKIIQRPVHPLLAGPKSVQFRETTHTRLTTHTGRRNYHMTVKGRPGNATIKRSM